MQSSLYRPVFSSLVRPAAVWALLMITLLSAPAGAQERGGWRIVEVSGAATVTRAGLTPVALNDRSELQGGEQIQTEATGRVILRRGSDTIIVAPGSSIALPARDDGLVTRILQSFGAVLVNVEKRANPNFEVRTPFLAAIVKGTTFTVSADALSSAVHVVEGAVRVVEAGNSQSTATVTAGQTARVNARDGNGLRVQGGRAAGPGGSSAGTVSDGSGKDRTTANDPRGATFTIATGIGIGTVDAVKATGGLVRNEGSTPSANTAERGKGNRATIGSLSSVTNSGLQAAGPPNNSRRAGPTGNGNGNGNSNSNGGGNAGGNGGGAGNGGGNAGGNGGGNGNGNGN